MGTIADLNELSTPDVLDYWLVRDDSDPADKDKKLRLGTFPIKSGTPVAGNVVKWEDSDHIGDAGFLAADIALKIGTPVAGNAARWKDATTVEDAGYLAADIALKFGTPTAGRVARWKDANTVEDGGFAVTDIARRSTTNTFDLQQTFTAGLKIGTMQLTASGTTALFNGDIMPNASNTYISSALGASIPDDGFVQLPVGSAGIFFLFSATNDSSIGAIVNYRAAINPYALSLTYGSNTNVITGTLNGVTGVDGKFTIAINTDGTIFVENRRGNARSINWMWIHI